MVRLGDGRAPQTAGAEISGAATHGLHRVADRSGGGHDHDAGVRIHLLNRPRGLHPPSISGMAISVRNEVPPGARTSDRAPRRPTRPRARLTGLFQGRDTDSCDIRLMIHHRRNLRHSPFLFSVRLGQLQHDSDRLFNMKSPHPGRSPLLLPRGRAATRLKGYSW